MKNEKINPKKIVDFMILAGKLKWLKRSGWLELKMPEPESVAEHTFRVAIISRVLAPFLGLNSEKLTAMAIFHDFAEGIFGDPMIEGLTEKTKIKILDYNKVEKKDYDISKEINFMKKVFDDLNLPELSEYWQENILENGPKATRYSDVLFQIGKIANVWQVFEYELRGVPKQVTKRFWISAETYVVHPFLKKILSAFKNLRKSYKV